MQQNQVFSLKETPLSPALIIKILFEKKIRKVLEILECLQYRKICVKQPLSKKKKWVFKADYCLMQVKSIAECSKMEHSSILLTFIKLPFVIKIFVLSIFEWLLKTGFTVPPKCRTIHAGIAAR